MHVNFSPKPQKAGVRNMASISQVAQTTHTTRQVHALYSTAADYP